MRKVSKKKDIDRLIEEKIAEVNLFKSEQTAKVHEHIGMRRIELGYTHGIASIEEFANARQKEIEEYIRGKGEEIKAYVHDHYPDAKYDKRIDGFLVSQVTLSKAWALQQWEPSSKRKKSKHKKYIEKLNEDAKLQRDIPNPYIGFNRKIEEKTIRNALQSHPDIELFYKKGRNDEKKYKVTALDLAAGHFGVDRVGKNGFSIGQLKKCFEVCNVGFHRAKASAVLKILQQLGLIVKTKRYYVGKHGNHYECTYGFPANGANINTHLYRPTPVEERPKHPKLPLELIQPPTVSATEEEESPF